MGGPPCMEMCKGECAPLGYWRGGGSELPGLGPQGFHAAHQLQISLSLLGPQAGPLTGHGAFLGLAHIPRPLSFPALAHGGTARVQLRVLI